MCLYYRDKMSVSNQNNGVGDLLRGERANPKMAAFLTIGIILILGHWGVAMGLGD
jgi:hypothetical protein